MIKDPALIVERILSPAEKRSLVGRFCVGNMQGAELADYLGIAYEGDVFINVTEPYYERGEAEELCGVLYLVHQGRIDRDRIAHLVSYAAIVAAMWLMPGPDDAWQARAIQAKVTYSNWVKTIASLMVAFEGGQLEASSGSDKQKMWFSLAELESFVTLMKSTEERVTEQLGAAHDPLYLVVEAGEGGKGVQIMLGMPGEDGTVRAYSA